MWAVLLLQAGRRCLLKAETRVQATSFQLRDAQSDIGGRPACSFFGFTLSVIHNHLIVVHLRPWGVPWPRPDSSLDVYVLVWHWEIHAIRVWRYVTGWAAPSVSKDGNSLIFKGQDVPRCPDIRTVKHEGTVLLLNVGNHPFSDTVSYPGRTDSPAYSCFGDGASHATWHMAGHRVRELFLSLSFLRFLEFYTFCRVTIISCDLFATGELKSHSTCIF